MTCFAEGMEEAMRLNDSFATEAEAAAYWADGIETVPTEDTVYTGAAGQTQAARRYLGGDGPPVFYIHGGGWVGGSIALNERACQHLARVAACTVISVSYRLAPAHPFPAGLDDCRAALHHFGAGRTMVLAGTSAGANLALALALDEPASALLLFYGVFSANLDSPSYCAFGEGFGLTRDRVAEVFDHYDPDNRRRHDPRLCPLLASDEVLAALPPSLILAAELDVLCDDSLGLATRLSALGRPHALHVETGVTHGFINRGRLVPAADACLDRAAAFLKDLP